MRRVQSIIEFMCLLKATVEALPKGQSLFAEDEGRGAVKGDIFFAEDDGRGAVEGVIFSFFVEDDGRDVVVGAIFSFIYKRQR
jgi:hypothetical protein